MAAVVLDKSATIKTWGTGGRRKKLLFFFLFFYPRRPFNFSAPFYRTITFDYFLFKFDDMFFSIAALPIRGQRRTNVCSSRFDGILYLARLTLHQLLSLCPLRSSLFSLPVKYRDNKKHYILVVVVVVAGEYIWPYSTTVGSRIGSGSNLSKGDPM